ncbi:hypothetical protein AVEN_1026-1 [Araneus ventricosus]|uniref:Uncharacterized protein n=1 Tax=Araneus ventricosus TaxID=182803 RepID=A0A4Y2L0P8_ARAVE|nr:hypothetical protein AVEN_1026-1 [Araneus ventricosus]
MAVLSTSRSMSLNLALKKNRKECSLEIWQDRWNLSETGRRTFIFVPQVNVNRASFNSRTTFIAGHGPFVTVFTGSVYVHTIICLMIKVVQTTGNRLPVTFFFTKPSAEDLSSTCVQILPNAKDPWPDSRVL